MRIARYGCVRTLVRVFFSCSTQQACHEHPSRSRVLKPLNRLRPHLRTTSYCSTHSKRHVFIQGFAREPGRRSSPTNKSNGGRTSRSLSSDLTGRSSRPFPDQVVYAWCRTTGKEETRLVVRSVGSIRGKPLGELPPGVDCREPGPGVVALALALHTHLQCSVQKPRAE
jgi:hypothetical protein